jgi:hypothetical protein
MDGNATTFTLFPTPITHYLIQVKIVLLETNSQTTEMIWVVLVVSTDKIERYTLVESKRPVQVRRQKISSQDTSKSGAKLNAVRYCKLLDKWHLKYVPTVRVLQYRSVAFVTYVSEFGAQFAKEAMACQSLDNDEILNVRWATEDPNPVQKVAEKRRLEEIGQEAIKARMDPRIVDAMRAVRALEDGDILDDEGEVAEDPESGDTGDPEPKRRRIELPLPQEATSKPPPQPLGLLSADTIEGLKYFAEIRKRNGVSAVINRKAMPPKPLTSGLGVADYGSDEED